MQPCKPHFINDHWLIGLVSILTYRCTRPFGCPLNLYVVRLSLVLRGYPYLSPQFTKLGVVFLFMSLTWRYSGHCYMRRSRSYFSISGIWPPRLSDGRRCRCCHPVLCVSKSPIITTCWAIGKARVNQRSLCFAIGVICWGSHEREACVDI